MTASPLLSRLSAAWSNPYFANFHPVTTTTWLLDRSVSDNRRPFDGRSFRATQLLYAVIAASLLILFLRRLEVPASLAALGALLYAVHPIHTEVVAWLSARKDLISLIFMLLSFLAWMHARSATTPMQWRVRHGAVILLALLAALSKPIAVVMPALFVAYEFCSGTHVGILRWRWKSRNDQSILTRTIALTAIFVVIGSISAVIFRALLLKDPMHGGWLILVVIAVGISMLVKAPSALKSESFETTANPEMRVLAQPFVALSVVSGAGSAWTFWAQSQVGAIKGRVARR